MRTLALRAGSAVTRPRASAVPRLGRAAAALFGGAVAATAGAQQQPAPGTTAVEHTLATNPALFPFAAVFGEYERAVGGRGLAVGLGGLVTFNDQFDPYSTHGRFASAQAKFKYYPAASGLRGFSVGVTGGVISGLARESAYLYPPTLAPCRAGVACTPLTTTTFRRATAPTVGAVADYNWLLGRQRHFLVGAGVGVRGVFGSQRAHDLFGDFLPDGRLVVGYGF